LGEISIEALAPWFGGLILFAVGWAIVEVLKRRLNPARIDRAVESWQSGGVPAPGTHFTILVADLDGDDSGRGQTRHVIDALEDEPGFRVKPAMRRLAIEDGPDRTEARLATERKGQTLLKEFNADVLVWGHVIPGGKGLRLRFLGPEGEIAGATGDEPPARRPGHYAVDEIGLPLDFNRDMNAVVIALAVASVAPATERQGHYLADLLEPQAQKLANLCRNLPAVLDPDQRGSVWHALALATTTLGEQKGDSARLEEAVQAYRAALEEWTRARVPPRLGHHPEQPRHRAPDPRRARSGHREARGGRPSLPRRSGGL
jgi:hypothetical protein